ncbi:hypothetical protein LAWI1_G004849, partial [Lachnellula willkommii]
MSEVTRNIALLDDSSEQFRHIWGLLKPFEATADTINVERHLATHYFQLAPPKVEAGVFHSGYSNVLSAGQPEFSSLRESPDRSHSISQSLVSPLSPGYRHVLDAPAPAPQMNSVDLSNTKETIVQSEAPFSPDLVGSPAGVPKKNAKGKGAKSINVYLSQNSTYALFWNPFSIYIFDVGPSPPTIGRAISTESACVLVAVTKVHLAYVIGTRDQKLTLRIVNLIQSSTPAIDYRMASSPWCRSIAICPKENYVVIGFDNSLPQDGHRTDIRSEISVRQNKLGSRIQCASFSPTGTELALVNDKGDLYQISSLNSSPMNIKKLATSKELTAKSESFAMTFMTFPDEEVIVMAWADFAKGLGYIKKLPTASSS